MQIRGRPPEPWAMENSSWLPVIGNVLSSTTTGPTCYLRSAGHAHRTLIVTALEFTTRRDQQRLLVNNNGHRCYRRSSMLKASCRHQPNIPLPWTSEDVGLSPSDHLKNTHAAQGVVHALPLMKSQFLSPWTRGRQLSLFCLAWL